MIAMNFPVCCRCSLGGTQYPRQLLRKPVHTPSTRPTSSEWSTPIRHQRRHSLVTAATEGWWQQFPDLWTSIHSDQQFDDILASAANVVLVECYGQLCGGCKLIQAPLSRIAADDVFKGRVVFAKVDTDEMDAFARANNVRTLPYVLVFRKDHGKLLGMELSPYKLKLLKQNLETILENRDCKDFRVDPNGFVVPIDKIAV